MRYYQYTRNNNIRLLYEANLVRDLCSGRIRVVRFVKSGGLFYSGRDILAVESFARVRAICQIRVRFKRELISGGIRKKGEKRRSALLCRLACLIFELYWMDFIYSQDLLSDDVVCSYYRVFYILKKS